MTAPHFAFLIVICAVWGFAFVAGKAGVEEIPPFLFTGLRYVLLSLVLIPFLRIHKGQMRNILLVSFVMGAPHFGLFYAGLALSDSVSLVAIVIEMSIPLAAFFSIFLLGETVGWQRWTGIGIALAGVAIILLDTNVVFQTNSILCVLGAAALGALGMVIMRRMVDVPVFTLQAWTAISSWPLLLIFSFFIEDNHFEFLAQAGFNGWGGVAYTALASSLVGHAGMFYLLKHYEVSFVTPMTLFAPIFGILFGIFVWGDVLTPRTFLGGGVTLIGVLIVALRHRDRKIRMGVFGLRR